MNKILVTSGCSFSENSRFYDYHREDSYRYFTWPSWLWKYLGTNYEFSSGSLGSQGNGLISRSIIYLVDDALKRYKPEDILVGVMWSGIGRFDYRCSNTNMLSFKIENIDDGAMENPTGFVKNAGKNWVIGNPGWKHHEAESYYRNFYDHTGHVIYTLEHMLRVQWYLKSKNIKYFFTLYTDLLYHDLRDPSPEVTYLYDMLDKDSLLPVTSELGWLIKEKVFLEDFVIPYESSHPSNRQHDTFTRQVILKYLEDKRYI